MRLGLYGVGVVVVGGGTGSELFRLRGGWRGVTHLALHLHLGSAVHFRLSLHIYTVINITNDEFWTSVCSVHVR